MKNYLFRVPIVFLILGFIDSLISRFIIIGLAVRYFPQKYNIIELIQFVISILLMLVGTLFIRDMTKKDIAKSCIVVCVYDVTVLIFEQFFQAINSSLILFVETVLMVPLSIHTRFISAAGKATGLNLGILIIASVFLPFVYVLFGKKSNI